jgi:hypothetical protein
MNNDLFNATYGNLINEVSKAVRTASEKVGGMHEKCKDCNRKLTDEHSKLIGKGPICRAESSLRFTVIPDVWASGPNQNRTETLDDLERTLEIDFTVLVRSEIGIEIFRRKAKAPYDWVATREEDFPRLALLDEHEYVQHNLIRAHNADEFDEWNALLILADLETGLLMTEHEALPRVFETFDEVDKPVCTKHLESWHEDFSREGETAIDAVSAIWAECKECNFFIDKKAHNMLVSLRDLTVEQMVIGDVDLMTGLTAAKHIFNPYVPLWPRRWPESVAYGLSARQENARMVCGYITEIQAAYWGSTGYEEGWIDNDIKEQIWENGHGCFGVTEGGLGWCSWDSTLATNIHERRIWHYIVASVREDLGILDEFGLNIEHLTENQFDYTYGTHTDEEWAKRMREWFFGLQRKNDMLVHIQQIPVIQIIAPYESWYGAEISPALPTIDINGNTDNSERFTCEDAYRSMDLAMQMGNTIENIYYDFDYNRVILAICQNLKLEGRIATEVKAG